MKNILQNEKYAGNVLTQKSFTPDFLTKKQKANEGELPQFFIEDDHEAIIPPDTFDLVQAEILARKGKKTSGATVFSSKIICGECGGIYGSKVWHSTDKYRKIIWRCNHKYSQPGYEKKSCNTPHLTEDEIKQVFLRALNEIADEKEEIIENTRGLIEVTTDTSAFEQELADVSEQMNALCNRMDAAITENMHTAIDQKSYNKAFAELETREEKLRSRYDELTEKISGLNAKRKVMENFLDSLQSIENTDQFDEDIWGSLVEKLTVNSRTDMVLTLKGGMEIQTGLEK